MELGSGSCGVKMKKVGKSRETKRRLKRNFQKEEREEKENEKNVIKRNLGFV